MTALTLTLCDAAPTAPDDPVLIGLLERGRGPSYALDLTRDEAGRYFLRSPLAAPLGPFPDLATARAAATDRLLAEARRAVAR